MKYGTGNGGESGMIWGGILLIVSMLFSAIVLVSSLIGILFGYKLYFIKSLKGRALTNFLLNCVLIICIVTFWSTFF